jgi:hypothetical protein
MVYILYLSLMLVKASCLWRYWYGKTVVGDDLAGEARTKV